MKQFIKMANNINGEVFTPRKYNNRMEFIKRPTIIDREPEKEADIISTSFKFLRSVFIQRLTVYFSSAFFSLTAFPCFIIHSKKIKIFQFFIQYFFKFQSTFRSFYLHIFFTPKRSYDFD